MASRPTSDSITTRKYSDFINSFSANPVSGQLGVVVNEASVKQSVRNIVLTNRGERIYKRDFGGDIYKLLFENATTQTILLAEAQIRTALKAYEPRIDVLAVNVNTIDSKSPTTEMISRFNLLDQNALLINVVYRIINTEQTQNISITVERLR